VDLSWIDLEQRHLIFKPEGVRNEWLLTEFRKQIYGG